MILVDTSVWIDHLRRGEPELAALLNAGVVLTHPLVVEELACGNLSRRGEMLDLLRALPRAPLAEHEEVLEFIAMEGLHGTGLGAVDAHLMASARLARATVWSKDKALMQAAGKLRLSREV
ncbi:MAG: type II toxin-antitoxin system VapC family toxin [Elusimicrobia bacterium]|nr:type II toxin-antitoxin system VapC family toxin [Elusimicrobiota bacterium]